VSRPLLSVVIPVYNEETRIARTVEEAAASVDASGAFDLDLVLVDDGSTDDTAAAARAAVARVGGRVVSQPNQGRLGARRTGLAEARGDYVLLLDSRVSVAPASLAFVGAELAAGNEVWNAHVEIEVDGNPYGRFWRVLTEAAFAEYFSSPRTTSFGPEEFDRFPKGTTCFLAPAGLLRDAFGEHRSRSYYADERNANDDTPILRRLAERRRIHISPRFRATYTPRASFDGFVRHAYHRGIVFLDGHGRRESRFFPAVAAFYPASAALVLLAARRPSAILPLAGVAAVAAGAAAARVSPDDAVAFGALAPVYAVAHGVGMWKGAALAAAKRLRPGRAA